MFLSDSSSKIAPIIFSTDKMMIYFHNVKLSIWTYIKLWKKIQESLKTVDLNKKKEKYVDWRFKRTFFHEVGLLESKKYVDCWYYI